MDTPSRRLEFFIKQRFNSRIEFCNKIGIRNDSLSKYIGEGENKSVFGKKYYERLVNLGLNFDWYLTGKGEMLIEDDVRKEKQKQLILSNDVVPVYDEIIDLVDKLPPDKLKEYLKAKRDFIEKTNIILNKKKEE
jgi:hypothetical protein